MQLVSKCTYCNALWWWTFWVVTAWWWILPFKENREVRTLSAMQQLTIAHPFWLHHLPRSELSAQCVQLLLLFPHVSEQGCAGWCCCRSAAPRGLYCLLACTDSFQRWKYVCLSFMAFGFHLALQLTMTTQERCEPYLLPVQNIVCQHRESALEAHCSCASLQDI